MLKHVFLLGLLAFAGTLQAGSRVTELFDRNDFIERPKISEQFWSSESNKLYGKSVIEWNEEDFAALEKKLAEQLVAERALYLAAIDRQGFIDLENTLKYETHRANLAAALEALPELRVWVDIARSESGDETYNPSQADTAGSNHLIEPAGDGKGTADTSGNPEAGPEEEEDDAAKLKAYLERERNVYRRKRLVLFYGAVIAIALIVLGAGWIWFRYYRIRNVMCPKCKASEKGMITASAPIKKGGSLFKVRVRRKYYCQVCGYKWVQRTR